MIVGLVSMTVILMSVNKKKVIYSELCLKKVYSSTPQPVDYPGILHATLFALIPNPSYYFHWKLRFHISGNYLKQIMWVRLHDETKDTSMLVRKASSSSLMHSLFILSTSSSRTCQKKKNSSKNMVCMRVNESTLNTLVTYQSKFFSPLSLPLARLSLCPAT